MARDPTEEEKKETPQIIEREVTLSLINEKLNGLTGLILDIGKKVGIKEED